jgi:hypothetical protein
MQEEQMAYPKRLPRGSQRGVQEQLPVRDGNVDLIITMLDALMNEHEHL